jgi:hypothetical protein
MIEVAVRQIKGVPGSEITLMDGRTKEQVWLVPVAYELADGCTVEHYRKVFGDKSKAEAYAKSLPMEPRNPTRCVFDEKDELVNVITKVTPTAGVDA